MAPVLAKDPDTLVSDEEIDAWVATLAWPEGWTVVGACQCSRGARGAILPTDERVVVVTLAPSVWVENWQPRASLGVYAAAQLSGLRTNLDQFLAVCCDIGEWAVQHYDPNSRPLCLEPVEKPVRMA